jgi:hypothetical protein
MIGHSGSAWLKWWPATNGIRSDGGPEEVTFRLHASETLAHRVHNPQHPTHEVPAGAAIVRVVIDLEWIPHSIAEHHAFPAEVAQLLDMLLEITFRIRKWPLHAIDSTAQYILDNRLSVDGE